MVPVSGPNGKSGTELFDELANLELPHDTLGMPLVTGLDKTVPCKCVSRRVPVASINCDATPLASSRGSGP